MKKKQLKIVLGIFKVYFFIAATNYRRRLENRAVDKSPKQDNIVILVPHDESGSIIILCIIGLVGDWPWRQDLAVQPLPNAASLFCSTLSSHRAESGAKG